MIGITAEQFPRGGALLLSLMGGTGLLSVAIVLPIMGARMDQYGPGAALQMVAALGAILTVIFTGALVVLPIARRVPRRGDYRGRDRSG